MKRSGILNAELSKVIAELGHTDTLVIADAGLPIAYTSKKVDLALAAGIPTFLETFELILEEVILEKIILADEIKNESPQIHKEIINIVKDIEIEYFSHEFFKQKASEAKCIVRTGEYTPFANIILVSGVDF